ncbi:MAG: hypothetical protein MZW92_51745 [Comamonadaceae bacterium]|nr:hypothetical protein [Comamonadaceae bacterium]
MKNAEALELAERIQVLAVDKTGTLTEGRPAVTDCRAGGRRCARMPLLRHRRQRWSRARPIRWRRRSWSRRAAEARLPPAALAKLEAVPGKGVVGRVGGHRATASARPAFLRRARGWRCPTTLIEPLQSPGQDAGRAGGRAARAGRARPWRIACATSSARGRRLAAPARRRGGDADRRQRRPRRRRSRARRA